MTTNDPAHGASYDDEVSPSVRAAEELVRTIARLKLRLEVCLRRERGAGEYRNTIVECLADVDDIARATVVAGTIRRVD